jgi:hypothetical protein
VRGRCLLRERFVDDTTHNCVRKSWKGYTTPL